MTLTEIANFLGWCTLLDFGLLILATLALAIAHEPVSKLHGKWFHMEPADLSRAYFGFLANFKILVIVFNLVPYLALRIMAM